MLFVLNMFFMVIFIVVLITQNTKMRSSKLNMKSNARKQIARTGSGC